MWGALQTVLANAAFLLVGVLGWRMFKGKPPRLPKVATVLMGIGGVALAQPVAWILGFVTGILPAAFAAVFALALAVAAVVMVWDIFNELAPKAGKVAAGQADYSTGLKAAAIPGLAVATGLVAASWYATAFSSLGGALRETGLAVFG